MGNARLKHFFIYENAAALPADQVTVSDQLLVRCDNGVARYIELLREFATGRQLHARRKCAVNDATHQFLTNLVLQIHWTIRIYVNDCVLHD